MGCPPFSGFFSKDAILALAYEQNRSIFVLALGTAFLTAFYVTRLLVVVFLGHPRSFTARTSRESPLVMVGPLIVLALFVVIGGSPSFDRQFVILPQERGLFSAVPLLAMGALVMGTGLAVALYRGRATESFDVDLFRRRFYIDEFYRGLIESTQEMLARVSAFFDRWIIDAGAVRGASGGTWGLGALLRLFQVGNLQAYSFLFGLGIVAVIYFAVFW
jgi:NADH-quinone oxidoreductase subunit L